MKKLNKIVSEEVYDAINTPPPWVIRNGLVTIFLIILTLLFFSSLVSYPETISIPLKIIPQLPSYRYAIEKSYSDDSVLAEPGNQVIVGDPLAILISQSRINKQIVSPINGEFFISYDFETDQKVLRVIPANKTFTIWGRIQEFNIGKIKKGQIVSINLKGKIKEIEKLEGKISEISSFPVNHSYTITITPSDNTPSSLPGRLIIPDTIECSGEVRVSSVSILRRIFKQFFHF